MHVLDNRDFSRTAFFSPQNWLAICGLLVLLSGNAPMNAQQQAPAHDAQKFAQLDIELPTPNTYRSASGAPGHAYWQQRADYNIKLELNDDKQRIDGEETITYQNNSPDALSYLWLQLDQNLYAKTSETYATETQSISDRMSFSDLRRLLNTFDGGFKIEHVKDNNGKNLSFTILHTMMRVDLPQPLKPGGTISFNVKWWYNVHNASQMGGREGYEFFPKDGNYTYHIAQFYPRLCAYTDVEGWQHKQFLGRGEFTLTFGNYQLSITVPEDHIVGATGELQNAKEVLTPEQRALFEKARTATEPVIIVSQTEAIDNEKEKATGKKTWVFKAENVRDVAFTSSRKYIWDAMGVPLGNRTVMAMSYYPKEGNPLWERFSTKVVAHTLRTYSKYTFDYPYPVAISNHASFTGMEYPMISFNFGRPEPDGTYSERTKWGMIGVIIHEVGHNWFPMIVNSDERQWTWMDEGLNSFMQYLSEQEFDRSFPSRRGAARGISEYMSSDKKGQVPIMTSSDNVLQFGNNSYGKPASALNILRETVMGRELFDFAFKEYSNRWKFKHPAPADFFRTMEDASGIDLDWFWRGWFYTVDHVDISLDDVKWFRIDTRNPDIEKPFSQKIDQDRPENISERRNREAIAQTAVEVDTALQDFYSRYNPFAVNALDQQEYKKFWDGLTEEERQMMKLGYQYYQLDFTNRGGLIMPLIIEFTFVDGTTEVRRIPAEVWRYHTGKVSKVFFFEKEVTKVALDPFMETADSDLENNYFPPKLQPSRFQTFKGGSGRYGPEGENPMQRDRRAKELDEKK
jgi:hypothetical protein